MVDGPISPARTALSFEELAELADTSREILRVAIKSLANYRDGESGGYFHVLDDDAARNPPTQLQHAPEAGGDAVVQAADNVQQGAPAGVGNEPGDYSRASSATVVPFLVRTGRWLQSQPDGDDDAAQRLLDRVAVPGEWKSAGLDPDNPFTVGFLSELLLVLVEAGAIASTEQLAIVSEKLHILKGSIAAGAVAVLGHEPNSYLTQLVVRALDGWNKLGQIPDCPSIDEHMGREIHKSAMRSIEREVALLSADPLVADVFELGYAILLAARMDSLLRPADRNIVMHGLDRLFAAQHDDGSWPRSRRLFFYPRYGNAYCYEYEFLVQALHAFRDRSTLWPYLASFQRSVHRLRREAVGLPSGGIGWASGHHSQLTHPESWSTASCFHFCHLAERLVAAAVTDVVLDHLDEPRVWTISRPSASAFDRLLDSAIQADAGTFPLKDTIRDRLVAPILEQQVALAEGQAVSKSTSVSAILYGPPGTSKTTYASAIAEALGWPLVAVDPSHLLRAGQQNIQPEMNRLFRMLAYAERVVILFDEFDELVRDRFGNVEQASRFMTTAMLPKIAQLRAVRRTVFLVATNHLEVFDAAIARPGRFDLILPVLTPTAEAKLDHWPAVKATFEALAFADEGDVRSRMSLLTYDEFETIADQLMAADDGETFVSTVNHVYEHCTMKQKVGDKDDPNKDWVQLLDEQKHKIRGLS